MAVAPMSDPDASVLRRLGDLGGCGTTGCCDRRPRRLGKDQRVGGFICRHRRRLAVGVVESESGVVVSARHRLDASSSLDVVGAEPFPASKISPAFVRWTVLSAGESAARVRFAGRRTDS
jgi:hypothetical protein